ILSGIPELRKGDPGRLLTEGIYARLRHPRYVEVILGVISYALVANYLGGYVVVLVTVASMVPLVLLEERELRDRFGDAYDEYARRVPRFIPRWQ
ncbi:MAG: isoprenylcysteine carboxylmethyltransferase family protein, partial [Gemmatimonadota bacterium]|nr:isoprenylcysteine carboxylmethyltransferase family protein [Gemmatimonadota bacterium]